MSYSPTAIKKLQPASAQPTVWSVFDPPQLGPFQQNVKQLALRFHQVPAGVSPDAEPVDITALPDYAGFEFTLGATLYRYSRFGLERLKANETTNKLQGEAG